MPRVAAKPLTDAAVRTAKAQEREYLKGDASSPGLYLRVLPSGAKSWLFQYFVNGKRGKMPLGMYPAYSLETARTWAADQRATVKRGIDPRVEQARKEAEELAAKALKDALPQTVEKLFELWERRELAGRKDNGAEVRRMFAKDVLPKLGAVPLDAIRRAHITAILDQVAERGANRIAGLLLADLRQMFTFAVNREILQGDPSAGLKKQDWDGQSKERDRVLTETEIRQLLKLLPTSTLTQEAQGAIKIMLSTCCRIGEIARARWTDVDMEKGEWTIPPENSKNAKAHMVSLSRFALDQFKAMRAEAESDARKQEREVSDWIMPAKHNSGCVCTKSMAKIIGDRQRGDAEPMKGRSPLTKALLLPGGKWTPHDLRRTGATLMSALGVRPDVIEKCLNHTEQNRLVRVYQRHEMRPEMAEAWRLLGERLELLSRADMGNVATMQARVA